MLKSFQFNIYGYEFSVYALFYDVSFIMQLIPARVIKDYDLHFPESITLVDPLVKKFGTLVKHIKIQTNGSVFVKGFGSILRRNKVKTTDKMICEIKKTDDNNVVQTMKIHIISG